MNQKLNRLFEFISNNRKYNKAQQERYYRSIILPYNNEKDKVISLLYNIANTQSQPNIDSLAEFYKSIYADLNCLTSFNNFIHKINPNGKNNYVSLYNGMITQKGWGLKTSALLAKTFFHLHNEQYSEELKIWTDIPKEIGEFDNFYLPVDSVIIAIFKKLDNSKKWTFLNINSTLKEYYNSQQIEIWDDLWFWGFVTQNGSGDNRKFEWNENKYWALKETDKNKQTIEEIKIKACEFLNIFN